VTLTICILNYGLLIYFVLDDSQAKHLICVFIIMFTLRQNYTSSAPIILRYSVGTTVITHQTETFQD